MTEENKNINELYDIQNTLAVIKEQDAKKIALQFPDNLLGDADCVTSCLRKELPDDVDLYILGDTTVCPCCVDTVAIEHMHADLVIHYGDACMSEVKNIPVYYSFEHTPIDIDCLVEAARDKFGGTTKTVYLGYDLCYYYCISTIYDALKEVIPNLVLGQVKHSQNLKSSEMYNEEYIKLGYHYYKTDHIDTEGALLFLSKDNANVSDYHENGNLYSVLVDSGMTQASVYTDYQIQPVNLNRFLMQRYVQIERFEHLSMIGIIIGTLSVKRYNEIVNHISQQAEDHDQTAYPFLVGKMNLPKLANFPGMEGFILIGCERSCFVDTSDYPFPIVTPYEYEISIGERSWENIYIHDYTLENMEYVINRKLLGEEEEEEVVETVNEEDIMKETSKDGQIIVFESRILDYINEQHYHGLEQKGDVSTPAVLKKGMKGIPCYYEDELF